MNSEKLEKLAISGAQKLCRDKCPSSYACGHPNKELVASLPLVCPEYTVCPLAKYNIKPTKENRPWWKIPREEIDISEAEMSALCSLCENSNGIAKDGTIDLKNFHRCLDCPVERARECQEELAAEAYCS